VIASCTGFDSTRAFELTRSVAGNIVTVHAGFTHINALTELPCIKLSVSLGDASTLLIGVLDLLRTRCQADSDCRQNYCASQLHDVVSVARDGQYNLPLA
jgi:crotonobetainyl-CoA:carnitine CoA-transferase CaiB-like acyl-CoA transferase